MKTTIVLLILLTAGLDVSTGRAETDATKAKFDEIARQLGPPSVPASTLNSLQGIEDNLRNLGSPALPGPAVPLQKTLDRIQTALDRVSRLPGSPALPPLGPEVPLDRRIDRIQAALNNLPINNTLVIDLRRGAGDGDKAMLDRLRAVVYTINSLNTTTSQLLTVDEILAAFPGGKLPVNGPAKFRLKLAPYLSNSQILTFRKRLTEDPMSCHGERELEDGIGADSLVRTAFNPDFYNELMKTPASRDAFERELGIRPEFDGEPGKRDEQAHRLLLTPGDSGVVQPNALRKLVLQTTRRGLLVARSEDSEQQNAARADHNFALNPVSARGDAHEEIWELPNGMRAFALRNRAGGLQTSAPPTLVTKRIINPVSCMSCHSSGFIATTGQGGLARSHGFAHG